MKESPSGNTAPQSRKTATNILAHMLLQLMAANYNLRPSLKDYLKSKNGHEDWINFSLGVRTENRSVEQGISFRDGKAKVAAGIPSDAQASLIFADDSVVREMLNLTPSEVLNLLLKSRMRVDGNLSYVSLFNFYISLLLSKKHQKMLDRQKKRDLEERTRNSPHADSSLSAELGTRKNQRMTGTRTDPGVRYLADPYLSRYGISDFPRLQEFLNTHFETTPELCHERPQLLTDWFMKNGFETDPDGKPWFPELRQGYAFKYLMENRKPIIRKNDLIAGTTTTREIGVVIYPDTHGTTIWGELKSLPGRILNPYNVSEETRRVYHHKIFPFWLKRNMREWVRDYHGQPLSQQLDERFAVYFMWKTAALSHTIADFPKLMRLGTKGMAAEIEDELQRDTTATQEKKDTLKAMILCLEGIAAYAKNLSTQAAADAAGETNPGRKAELQRLAGICARVPENPCSGLDEALNAIWIGWVGLHMENTNAGLSLGRMDQWLQPYFESDMAKLQTEEEREAAVKRAIELLGCFYMRCTDHLPLVPDIGNYLFGGSSSDQAITLGGITPEGEDAVNDMTYIFLKVTEILGIRDPNVNARFNPDKNSATYLKRLCEVNLITAATPSMHNDKAVMESLAEFNYPIEDLRDWSATGCVEPTLSAKHIGHTNCMMMNMVAALEMAMNNGRHPLMNWDV
ncbi:MAG: pyruvate formate lyase family protein [Smithellaceae bacterium]|nr:pyruvate formate lyase family protein [Smithellaceae bacterium]